MTRLKNSDICHISANLANYDSSLQAATGRSMLGIACHGWGVDEILCRQRLRTFSVDVIPMTAGLGVITRFSKTVADILKYLGCTARVTDKSDTAGLASAYESGADIVMMADDNRFVGINLRTQKVSDNTQATGRVFAAALDLMAGGVAGRNVLVMGCGPVGEAAAKTILRFGATVSLYDVKRKAAVSLCERLCRITRMDRLRIEDDLESAVANTICILEATPSENSITEAMISDDLLVAAPGVPLGLTPVACQMLKNRIVHDILELGVAAMAVDLVVSMNQGDISD